MYMYTIAKSCSVTSYIGITRIPLYCRCDSIQMWGRVASYQSNRCGGGMCLYIYISSHCGSLSRLRGGVKGICSDGGDRAELDGRAQMRRFSHGHSHPYNMYVPIQRRIAYSLVASHSCGQIPQAATSNLHGNTLLTALLELGALANALTSETG